MNRRQTVLLSLTLMCSALNAQAGDWRWSVAPYVWATDVGAKVSLDQRPVVDKRLGFSDLVKDLDFAAQFRLEAQRHRHGVMADVFAVGLSKEDARLPLPSPAGATALLDSKITMTIIEAGGLFNPRGDRNGLSILYGSRIIRQNAEIDASIESAPARRHESEDTLIDALIGARFAQRLSRRWSGLIRGDLSKGGTDLTWSAGGGLSYAFDRADRYVLTAGYRYMKVNFAPDHSIEADMTLSGFATGFRINF